MQDHSKLAFLYKGSKLQPPSTSSLAAVCIGTLNREVGQLLRGGLLMCWTPPPAIGGAALLHPVPLTDFGNAVR
jgi:hypothetical protein